MQVGYDRFDVLRYLRGVRRTLAHPNVALDLRIRHAQQYRCAGGDVPPPLFLQPPSPLPAARPRFASQSGQRPAGARRMPPCVPVRRDALALAAPLLAGGASVADVQRAISQRFAVITAQTDLQEVRRALGICIALATS